MNNDNNAKKPISQEERIRVKKANEWLNKYLRYYEDAEYIKHLIPEYYLTDAVCYNEEGVIFFSPAEMKKLLEQKSCLTMSISIFSFNSIARDLILLHVMSTFHLNLKVKFKKSIQSRYVLRRFMLMVCTVMTQLSLKAKKIMSGCPKKDLRRFRRATLFRFMLRYIGT